MSSHPTNIKYTYKHVQCLWIYIESGKRCFLYSNCLYYPTLSNGEKCLCWLCCFSPSYLSLCLPLWVRDIPVLCEQWCWTKFGWTGCTLRHVQGSQSDSGVASASAHSNPKNPGATDWLDRDGESRDKTQDTTDLQYLAYYSLLYMCTWSTCKNRLVHRLNPKQGLILVQLQTGLPNIFGMIWFGSIQL